MFRKACLNPSEIPIPTPPRLRGVPGSAGEVSVMRNLIVDRETVYELMHHSMAMAATTLPCDVEEAFLEFLREEKNEFAKLSLETILKNCNLGLKEGRPICSDTGYPLYYVKIGDHVTMKEGFSVLYEESKRAVSQLTAENILRANMVNPFTWKNTGDNTGYHIPHIEIRFDATIDCLEIIAVPKGGGSEIFGTFYRMMYPGDGKKGMLRFILDCVKDCTFAGKSCPPNILGIGIGGTSDISMKLAKEAAVLRPIGSRHPDGQVAEFELELLGLIRTLGIGPMAMGGSSGILDVHVEYAVTHTSALPVAFNAQCSLARRKAACLQPDGEIVYSDLPNWNYR
jgi:tartrate/fumarate subfamily iron-sulfur-dependent hydro-lyase alpha chain